MYLITNNKNECTGCSACVNICRKHAISICTDEEGFSYPKINHKKCVNCGICKKICPSLKNQKNFSSRYYGAKLKEENIRINSSSGAAFMAFARYIINENGAVYGAAIEDDMVVRHIRVSNLDRLNKLQKSKYVQSEISDVFMQVKKDLENATTVLFVGTPCQVAGLKSFLGNEFTDNLYTCDLICHGVPSPKVYNDYLKFISKNCIDKIKDFNFRDKAFGWGSHYETYYIKNRKFVDSRYRQLFYSDYVLRPSCYSCNYSCKKRVGDLTIGDFWGLKNINKDFYDNKGVSLVLVNNKKGEYLFESVKSTFDYFLVNNIEDALQRNLVAPTELPGARSEFWNYYNNNSFKAVIKKYTKPEYDKNTNKFLWLIHKAFSKVKGVIKQYNGR